MTVSDSGREENCEKNKKQDTENSKKYIFGAFGIDTYIFITINEQI